MKFIEKKHLSTSSLFVREIWAEFHDGEVSEAVHIDGAEKGGKCDHLSSIIYLLIMRLKIINFLHFIF